MAKQLYLIDGHAHIFRAFYAVEGLSAPDGRPTGAAFGFTRMLLDVLKRQKPDYIAAAFDAPGKTFRHDRFAAYKATRKPTPPELHQQVPIIHEIVHAYGIPVFELAGFEADDVLGTLAAQAVAEGVQVVLVTGDKDCGQLLGDHVRMYDAQKDRFLTAADFEKEKGVSPERLTDLMGLWGDSSDNIPGVPGIGAKIGAQLIDRYGSLEALLDHAEEIKGKRGEVLRTHADQARLSKELATIRTDTPVTLDLAACAAPTPDTDRLAAIFEDLGFKSLLHQLRDGDGPAHKDVDYIAVTTRQDFDALAKALRSQDHIAVDTETTGVDPLRCELVGISLSWEPRTAYYLPFRAPPDAPVLGEEELERLGRVLADERITKTGQNLKYDQLVLQRAGVELRGIVFDSLLASNLLNGHLTAHDLDTLALRYLDIKKIPTRDLIGSGKKQISMAEVPLSKITAYACEDADVALRLEEVLGRDLEADAEAKRLFETLELPLSFVLADMQQNGIRVDCDLLARQSAELTEMLANLTDEIHKLAGHAFNIASPKQLGVVLFEELGLPVLRRTKTGPSTNEATLTELAAMGHELPERLLEYRTYAKLKNTYLDALPQLVHPDTERIHTTFSQTITATGRLSSRDPNLQNIPVRTELGRTIRAAFVPEPGWKLLAADYSQVELRMLAHYAQDEMLGQAFEEGRDIHRVVASEVNGIPEDEVTRQQRSAAKAINFGIIYGQTAHGLSQSTDMSVSRAKEFIDSYFERFPRVRGFIDKTIERAHADGYVRTLLGRKREIPELKSNNKGRRARAEREAVNTVIQGSAADLIKTAMVRLHERLRAEQPEARMLLQIHDELVLEAPPDAVDAVADAVREEMEAALPLSVPIAVDLGVGNNWLELK